VRAAIGGAVGGLVGLGVGALLPQVVLGYSPTNPWVTVVPALAGLVLVGWIGATVARGLPTNRKGQP
jgi:ABC-type antimicrobial peptide transport system permease subunit